MAISEAFTGTKAVDTTTWSLVTNTSYDTGDASAVDGVYQTFLDLSDMIAGDELEIRIYEKVLSSSTQRIIHQWILSGVQSSPIWVSPSLIFLHGWDVTVEALTGTINVNWSIRKVA